MDLQAIGIIFGITVAVATGASFIMSKVFKLGQVSQKLETLSDDLADVKTEIKESGRAVTKRIDDLIMTYAQKGLAESNSPRQLTPEGKKVLDSSGVGEIVEDKLDLIIKKVKADKPENSYQAEQAILKAVEDLQNDPTLKDAIEEGAFNSGYFVPSVLFVGGIYIRDRVLENLGLKPEEIDDHDPNNPKNKRRKKS